MSEKKLRLLTTSEVKEILTRELLIRDDPTNEQKYAKEQADRFGRLKSEPSVKLVDELMDSVPRVKEHLAYKIADFLPDHPDYVRAIFTRERFTLSDDEVSQIIEIVEKYLPKEK